VQQQVRILEDGILKDFIVNPADSSDSSQKEED